MRLVKTIWAQGIDLPDYSGTGFKFGNSDLGGVLSELLPYIYVFAGLILLIRLIVGGLSLMTSAGNPDKMKAGYGKITSALLGFFIIFLSYIIVMLVERIFGVTIF